MVVIVKRERSINVFLVEINILIDYVDKKFLK